MSPNNQQLTATRLVKGEGRGGAGDMQSHCSRSLICFKKRPGVFLFLLSSLKQLHQHALHNGQTPFKYLDV